MIMTRYSKEFKDAIIKRMMPPQNESVVSISRETGVSENTLYQWKRKARANGFAVPAGEEESEKWTTHDKFLIVVETVAMSEVELAEYCRSKGLFVEQVQAWRDACMQANGGVAQEAAKLHRSNKEKDKQIKKLNSELKRKEAALAETAALIVLKKKAQAIWGANEDE